MDPITIAAATGLIKTLGIDQVVGRWLGGDKGAAFAGKVVDVAQQVTGLRNPEEIAEQLKADLAANATLRQRVLDLADAEAQREALDRQSARDMQKAALEQDDVFSKRFVYYFAAAWSAFAMTYLVGITFIDIPAGSQRFADTILGVLLGTIIPIIIAYFYGSSRSSQGKDNAMHSLVEVVKSKGAA
ncbi:hypothetical protein [Pseudomonas sp. KCJK9000]|uniref:hypothetical protein n=1 Tax=Pseudomonas sp. KCJK9000 TaxID=3344566 RepID=UPI003906B27F